MLRKLALYVLICAHVISLSSSSTYFPTLSSFDFDWSVGNLTMYFDSLMSIPSLDLSKVELYAHNTNASHMFLLPYSFNNLTKQGNSSSAYVLIPTDSYAALKADDILSHDNTKLYISIKKGSILSAFGDPVTAVNISDHLRVSATKNDTLSPFVSSYGLNMDSGELCIIFTEPINVETFTLRGLALQASRNSKIAPEQWSQYYQLDDYHASIVSLTNFKRTLTINLGEYNINIIKSIIGLATTSENTYLSAWQPFVNDTSGNMISLVAFDYLHGIKPTYYQPDITPPYLVQWHFDMNDAALSLFFSETVYITFFNFSAIQLTNGQGVFLRIHEPLNRTDVSTHIVRMNLNQQQLRAVQAMDNFFINQNTTYIVLEENIVVDTSVNQNPYYSLEATEINPMKVAVFVPDITQPRLLRFDLNLEIQEMTLHFSKAMKISSIDLQHLRLQAAADSLMHTEFMFLSSGEVSVVTVIDSPDIIIRLSDTVRNRFRMHPYLGKSVNTTFIAISCSFITDRAPARNRVVDVTTASALQVSNLIPDSEQPYLTGWKINLDANTIDLNFSKPLEVDSINLSAAYLTSDSFLLPSTFKLSLADSQVVGTAEKMSTVVISLSSLAILNIKDVVGFCSSVDDCYLSFSANLGHSLIFVDNNSSKVYADVESVSFLPPAVYIPDDIPPNLLSFTYDAEYGQLALRYDEFVRTSTFNFSNIILYSTVATHGLTLSPFTIVKEAIDSSIHLLLTKFDFMKLSGLFPLGQTQNATRLFIESHSVQDVLGNYARTHSLVASDVFSTRGGPKLLSGYIDATLHHNLTLVFSSYVNISRLAVSGIYLVATSGVSFSLSGSRVLTTTPLTSMLVLDMSPISTRVLVANNLGQRQSNSYVAIEAGANLYEAYTSQTPAHLVTVPTTSPLREGINLMSFVLNMLAGEIVLEMSMSMDIAAIRPTYFVISNGLTQYQLQSTTTFTVNHRYRTLILTLSAQDHHALQEKLRLVVAAELQITIASTGIIDIHGKEISLTTTSLICSQLIVDTSPPTVQSYELDLQDGTMSIQMSKPVVISTLTLDNTLTITNGVGTNAAILTLTNLELDASLVGVYMSDTIVLNLNLGHPTTTREQLMMAYPMGNLVNYTFLTVRKGFAFDNSVPSNPSTALSVSQALKPTRIVLDTVAPQLVTYAIDLTQCILYMNFTEAVNIDTLRIEALTFGAKPTNTTSAAHYTLTSSSTMKSLVPTPYVAIQISIQDYNHMMELAPKLLINIEETYLSFEESTFTDLAGVPNGNEVVYFRYGIQATSFSQDASSPRLLSYNVSLAQGYIDMVFHKVVNCQQIFPEKILFQSQQFLGNLLWDTTGNVDLFDYLVRLSNASYCLGITYSPHIRIIIDYEDMVRIQASSWTLKSINSTFLRFDTGAIYDVFGNSNTALGDNEGVRVQSYEGDISTPQLLAYTVTTTKSLFLFFNKPVDVTSLKISQLSFQNAQSHATLTYALQATSLYRTNRVKTILEYDLLSDFMRIFGVTFILHQQSQTFLSITSDQFVSDYAGNVISTFYNATNGLNIGPKVIAWDFDAGDGYLQLQFNEPVAAGFRLVGVTLQGDPHFVTGVTHKVSLTSTLPAVRVGHSLYHGYLNAQDLNAIKLSGLIPSYQLVDGNYTYHPLSLYLTTPAAMAHSIHPDGLIQNLSSVRTYPAQALPIRYYSMDRTPPKCKYFDLDLDAGIMAITFSEAIDMTNINYAGIILYSSQNGEFYVFDYQQNNSYPTLQQQVILHIELYANDLTLLKYLYQQGKGLDRLMIQTGAVQDVFGNQYPGNDMDHPVRLRQFVPDSSPPQLLEYHVFLNSEDYRLRLIFDEMIEMSTFDIRNIILLSSWNVSFSLADMMDQYRHTPDVRGYHGTIQNVTYLMLSTYTLYNYTYEYITNAQQAMDKALLRTIDIDIGFLKYDAFAMELLSQQSIIASGDGAGAASPPFYRSLETAYVMIVNVSDVFGHTLPSPVIAQATDFYPVSISTTVDLESFDMVEQVNGNTLIWRLYFNNIMNVSTFDCSDFTFISSRSASPSYTTTLRTTDCHLLTTSNSHIIQIEVASSLFPTRLGYAQDETFIRSARVVSRSRDLDNHGVSYLSYDTAVQVGPQLLKASVDMSTAEVILLFSKEMDVTTFQYVNNLGFYSSVTRSTHMLSRMNETAPINTVVPGQYFSTTLNKNDTVVRFRLEDRDFHAIKLLQVQPNALYVNLVANAAYDNEGKGVNRRVNLPVTRIIHDYHNPILRNSTLDMGKGILTLWFNEPIDLNSIDLTAIRFQSTPFTIANASNIYEITTATVTRNIANELVIQLSHHDVTLMKLNPYLAKDQTTSYLSVKVRAMMDMNGNYLPSISIAAASQIDRYIADTVAPVLDSFALDISHVEASYLTLSFSEPMLASSINLTAITIQSRYIAAQGSVYTLTGGTVLSDDSDVITIELLPYDVLQMKLLPGLIRKIQQTYIVSSSALGTDLAGNEVEPRVDGYSLRCTSYAADTASPVIDEIHLDMQLGVITIYLNEPVILTTINVTTLTLLSTRPTLDSDPYYSYTLSADSVVTKSAPLASVVIITLSVDDFNSIKAQSPLARNQSSVFFSFTASFMSDFVRNAIAPRSHSQAIHCAYFIQDTTRPSVVRYELNMNSHTIQLTFSEAIDATRVWLEQLVVQNMFARRHGNSITCAQCSSTVGSYANSTVMIIHLDAVMIKYMKYVGIGKDQTSSYLSWGDWFVTDNAGNQIIPQWDGSIHGFAPILPNPFYPDSQAPLLLRWYLDRHNFTLSMYFDEPISLLNTSAMHVIRTNTPYPTITTTYTPVPSYPLHSSSWKYFDNNTLLMIALTDYCVGGSFETLVSITDVYTIVCSNQVESLFNYLNASSPSAYKLAIPYNVSVVDFAKASNSLNETFPLAEGQPDCSACPSGSYVTRNCSTSWDRVCTTCKACGKQHYISETCESYRDSSCAACSVCPFGEYIQQPCTDTTNTVCARCDVCPPMTFPSRYCTLGYNTICDSCQVCQFPNEEVREHCEAQAPYKRWKEKHCCTDPHGRVTLCESLLNYPNKKNEVLMARPRIVRTSSGSLATATMVV